jgi:hypothetical protein
MRSRLPVWGSSLLGTVTLLSGHGSHLSKAQNNCQITNFNLSGSRAHYGMSPFDVGVHFSLTARSHAARLARGLIVRQ